MDEILQTIICLYICVSAIILISISVECIFTGSKYNLCPKPIYDHTNLNIFGTALVFILLFCLMPYYYIFWFIYWICHVGRK